MILSGAGLSAESGIKTFRGHDGLWENYKIKDVCSVEGYKKNPQLIANFYDSRRKELAKTKPNLAHKKIAELKEKYSDLIAIITQNVDNLLEQAGCKTKDVVHVHGTLTDLRCQVCGEVFSIGYESQENKTCPKCNSKDIRHNVVMFGEPAPEYQTFHEMFSDVELFIVIGSSGQVLPLGTFASYSTYSILNNLEEDHLDQFFTKVITKPATEGILEIEKEIEYFIKNTKLTPNTKNIQK
jgi:NAD-dependent deacetylase